MGKLSFWTSLHLFLRCWARNVSWQPVRNVQLRPTKELEELDDIEIDDVEELQAWESGNTMECIVPRSSDAHYISLYLLIWWRFGRTIAPEVNQLLVGRSWDHNCGNLQLRARVESWRAIAKVFLHRPSPYGCTLIILPHATQKVKDSTAGKQVSASKQ